MSAYKIQTPGNYPEESIQHSEHDESLKSGNCNISNRNNACSTNGATLSCSLLWTQPLLHSKLLAVNMHLEPATVTADSHAPGTFYVSHRHPLVARDSTNPLSEILQFFSVQSATPHFSGHFPNK